MPASPQNAIVGLRINGVRMHKKLPIGVQTLAKLREQNCYYADKTLFIERLVAQGSYYFLSRPRRFGKSLFLDTLKEAFEGNKSLFAGLYIEDKWDWAKKHPVVRLSFGGGTLKTPEALNTRIISLLNENAERLDITLTPDDIPGQFFQLLHKTHARHGNKVVLLIDEYDKPILDNITQPETARDMREGLKNLYTCIKDADPLLQFCFLTGVSKFSKVSLFSGLNNLTDITLDAQYSAICGYTDEDIDTVFLPETQRFDREEIRRWYNGYNWLGTSVYNPFDVLLLFTKNTFNNYWFETATPTFLVELLRSREFFTPKLAQFHTTETLLSQFDVDAISEEALLFQAGYLTILSVEEYIRGKWHYTLTYPNQEVQTALNECLLPAMGASHDAVLLGGMAIIKALKALDFSALELQLKSLYASIPHNWHRKNNIRNYEGHYASVFYSHFAALGLQVQVEHAVATGQIDMVVIFNNSVFIFEFIVVKSQATGAAIAQIKSNNYAEKYHALGYPIYLIGVEFSRAKKNIVGFDVEQAH